MSAEFDKLMELSNATIHIVKVRFYLKIKRRDNTCNGNGFGMWYLTYAWLRKRGSIHLFTQTLGDGDNGDRCVGKPISPNAP